MRYWDDKTFRQPSRQFNAVRTATIMLAMALLTVVSASAHVPTVEPANAPVEGTPISGPDVSRAIYGHLDADKEHDAYTFTVSTPLERQIYILVPAYPEHADFRPTLVVTAQGAPPLEVVDPGRANRTEEWEPFSLTTFWKGAQTNADFESGRQYTIQVEPGDGARSGRYVIVFGGPERFTTPDTLGTLRDLPTVWFGAYGGAPLRWNWWALVPLSVVASIAAAMAWLVFTGLHVSRSRRYKRYASGLPL